LTEAFRSLSILAVLLVPGQRIIHVFA
jgi:hypothetical protein